MSFETTTLMPGVVVYHNTCDNKFYQDVLSLDQSEWTTWGSFGLYLRLATDTYIGDPFEFSSTTNISEEPLLTIINTFNKIFKETTLDYISKNNISLPNWQTASPQLSKYHVKKVKFHSLILPFHTDYQQERSKMPGIKHGLTANLYINDDYEGGEVLFNIDGSEEIVKYKPKMGDMVIFPSGLPFYHGVRNVLDGEKYLIRSFWHFRDDGDPEYLEEKAKWDPEVWKEKETLRQKIERNKYMKWIKVN
jgi:hypothetical protein